MSVKVFVVDDSAVVRQALAHMLSGNAEVELIGSAPNPLLAMDMIRKNPPDVLLLDIEMPGMDGLTFLRQIMSTKPIPTVICSTLSTEGSKVALEALASGAVAVPPFWRVMVLPMASVFCWAVVASAIRAWVRPLIASKADSRSTAFS